MTGQTEYTKIRVVALYGKRRDLVREVPYTKDNYIREMQCADQHNASRTGPHATGRQQIVCS